MSSTLQSDGSETLLFEAILFTLNLIYHIVSYRIWLISRTTRSGLWASSTSFKTCMILRTYLHSRIQSFDCILEGMDTGSCRQR